MPLHRWGQQRLHKKFPGHSGTVVESGLQPRSVCWEVCAGTTTSCCCPGSQGGPVLVLKPEPQIGDISHTLKRNENYINKQEDPILKLNYACKFTKELEKKSNEFFKNKWINKCWLLSCYYLLLQAWLNTFLDMNLKLQRLPLSPNFHNRISEKFIPTIQSHFPLL